MNEERQSGVAQAAGELRQAWRDLTGGVRSTGRSIAGEGKTILAELDAPQVERPRLSRRGWRRFRRAPLTLQILVGLVVFALWAVFVFRVFFASPSPREPRPPHTSTSVSVLGVLPERNASDVMRPRPPLRPAHHA